MQKTNGSNRGKKDNSHHNNPTPSLKNNKPIIFNQHIYTRRTPCAIQPWSPWPWSCEEVKKSFFLASFGTIAIDLWRGHWWDVFFFRWCIPSFPKISDFLRLVEHDFLVDRVGLGPRFLLIGLNTIYLCGGGWYNPTKIVVSNWKEFSSQGFWLIERKTIVTWFYAVVIWRK